jgi:hypothetical protein
MNPLLAIIALDEALCSVFRKGFATDIAKVSLLL